MNNEVRLSQSSSEMFNNILEDMRNNNFDAVNFPLLLWGILSNDEEENGHVSLESYICSNGNVSLIEIEDSIVMAFSDYHAKLLESYENGTLPAKSEIASTLSFTDFEGNKITFPASSEIVSVYEKLFEIIKNFSINQIEPIHFTLAMFAVIENKWFKHFLKELNLNYYEAKRYFRPENILNGVIPFALTGFLNVVNDKINPAKPCDILMRDEESELLWNIMLKKNKRNAVIVGEAGVGKTALVEKNCL